MLLTPFCKFWSEYSSSDDHIVSATYLTVTIRCLLTSDILKCEEKKDMLELKCGRSKECLNPGEINLLLLCNNLSISNNAF